MKQNKPRGQVPIAPLIPPQKQKQNKTPLAEISIWHLYKASNMLRERGKKIKNAELIKINLAEFQIQKSFDFFTVSAIV